MKVWNRGNYTVEEVSFNHDLHAFEITQGDNVQTIYPGNIEDMNSIIEDLDNGEDVNGWEDGNCGTITID